MDATGLTRGQAAVAKKLVQDGIPQQIARDVVISAGYTMRSYSLALSYARAVAGGN